MKTPRIVLLTAAALLFALMPLRAAPPENPQYFSVGGQFNSVVGAVLPSAATIAPDHGIHHVSGTTQITTITAPWNGFTGCITFIPDGNWSFGPTGNIAIPAGAQVNTPITECFDGNLWRQPAINGERMLGRALAANLNSVAATAIFQTPASGNFSRCMVTRVLVSNYSMAATTASVSYGASATPTDWAATATNANAATTKFLLLSPTATLAPVYATAAVNFVANVTIAQGAAATADIAAFGYCE